jgi:glyoxylase-like metal-dependent hydrolase (beta-lactamase superfamily II)
MAHHLERYTMHMIPIAPGVTQLALAPRQAINAYLIGTVLVDAGIRASAPALLRALAGLPLSAHVLTHAHADHQGASAAVCAARGIPLWCGPAERAAAESGSVTSGYPNPTDPVARLQQRFWAGPGWPVARTLQEGDIVGDFSVVETPGHAPGHLALWRERDGVLLAGDALVNMDLLTTVRGLREPPARFTADPRRNRLSIQKLAALRPRVVCFGHGPALREPTSLERLAEQAGRRR